MSHYTAQRAARKVPLLVILGVSLVSLGFVAMRRGGGKSPSQGVVVVARHGVGRAAGSHSVAPAPNTATSGAKPRAFSSDYKVLLIRSIFAIGGKPLMGRSASAVPTATVGASMETTLFLKGISQEDLRFSAFVEDAVAKRIVEVHVGEALGGGRIADMTVRDLGYEVGGKVMRIEIGSGLNGSAAGLPMPTSQVALGSVSGKSARKRHPQ